MEGPLAEPAALHICRSAPQTGIGASCLVLIGVSNVADFRMCIFNADGSEALMCGNATICVGSFLYDHKPTRNTSVTLGTQSGVREVELHVDGVVAGAAAVNMGPPRIFHLNTLVQCGTVSVVGAEISMGNPHFVVYVDGVTAVDLESVGPLIEHDSRFVDRTSVEFAHVCDDGTIRMRVWERGSGVTQGCGSSASVTAVAVIA